MRTKPYGEESLRDYCALLASSDFAPGGGSAAALSAALSAALCAMSRAIGGSGDCAELAALRERALTLLDRDAEAFAPVAEAWKLPRDDPRRAEILESAHQRAAEAPLSLLELCGDILSLCEQLREECRESILPDVASAAALCRGAADAAFINVLANTHYMKNRAEAQVLNRRAEAQRKDYEQRSERCIRSICEGLG